MPLPDLKTVQLALAPLEPALTDAFMRAWKDWRSAPYAGHWHKRGRANFVWEQAVHYAATTISEMPGVKIVPKDHSFHFLVNGQVAFRMKKADSTGFTSNYPTQEALAFHDPQLPLTGIEAAQRVEVTYVLDKTETKISDISVVARDGNRIEWTYSILNSESIASLPSNQQKSLPAKDSSSTGLVSPKGRKKNQDEGASEGEQ
jgi:hypothetical protein